MVRSLWTAATGMNGQQANIDAISNNLSNVNTTGYKQQRVEFEDLMYQTVKAAGTPATEDTVTPVGIQMGTGVKVGATQRIVTQGSLQNTGVDTDLAVVGEGYFRVQQYDGSFAYTRDGAFKVDMNGQLVTSEGLRVKQSAAGYADKVNPDFAKAPAVAKHEETVVALLLLFAEHRKTVFEKDIISEENFFTDLNKRIFRYVKESYENADTFANLNEIFAPEEVGRIVRIKNERMKLANNDETVLLESIEALKSSMEKKTAAGATTFDQLTELIKKMRSDSES